MSRLEELPDRKTELEAGDVVEFYDKEYIVKGMSLDSISEPQKWMVVTEDGLIDESKVELVHKRQREDGY